MGETSVEGLIKFALALPLDSTAAMNYSEFFDYIYHVEDRRDVLVALMGRHGERLQGERKLVIILACLQTKARAGETETELVLWAAKAALAIMSSKGIAASNSTILPLMRQYRTSFTPPGSVFLNEKFDVAHAEVAGEVLELLRAGT